MMQAMWWLLAALPLGAAGQEAEAPASQKVDLRVDLSKDGALERFDRSDPRAWRLAEDGEGEDVAPCLELFGASRYQPPHRSPLNLALLRDWEFSDFVLDVELRQTGREYGHRDLCLLFGFERTDRYCYVHLASKADENAHNVFRVEEAPRRNFAARTTEGVAWGDGWHHVRLVRSFPEGKVLVYFDDLSRPIMEAVEKDPAFGRVGFGSFDDTGRFREIRVRGTGRRLPEGAPSPFPAPDPDDAKDR